MTTDGHKKCDEIVYIQRAVSARVFPSLISHTVSVDVKHHVYLLPGWSVQGFSYLGLSIDLGF